MTPSVVVMTVEGVYRNHGLQLVGRLECGVRRGDEVEVNGESVHILDIQVFEKSLDFAPAGYGVALAFQHDLPQAKVGDAVSKQST
jgi:selenocysteine-specific translation elongation factor